MKWSLFIPYIAASLLSMFFVFYNIFKLANDDGNIGLTLGWVVNLIAWLMLWYHEYMKIED